jgi:hypothetical protein
VVRGRQHATACRLKKRFSTTPQGQTSSTRRRILISARRSARASRPVSQTRMASVSATATSSTWSAGIAGASPSGNASLGTWVHVSLTSARVGSSSDTAQGPNGSSSLTSARECSPALTSPGAFAGRLHTWVAPVVWSLPTPTAGAEGGGWRRPSWGGSTMQMRTERPCEPQADYCCFTRQRYPASRRSQSNRTPTGSWHDSPRRRACRAESAPASRVSHHRSGRGPVLGCAIPRRCMAQRWSQP